MTVLTATDGILRLNHLGDAATDSPVLYWTAEENTSPEKLTLAQLRNDEEKASSVQLVLLDNHLCSYTNVTVPRKQHSQLQKVLPFLCEEFLCGDVEQLHIAAGAIDAEQVRTSIIETATLKLATELLHASAIHPRLISTEADLLRTLVSDQDTLLWIQPDRAFLVQQGDVSALNVKDPNLLLESLSLPAASRMLFFHSDGQSHHIRLAIEAWQTDGVQIETAPVGDDESVISALVRLGLLENAVKKVTNLLQGDFKPAEGRSQRTYLRPLALAAAILAGLQLTYTLGSGLYFSHRADALETANRELYREYFPQDRRIVNIRTQTLGHLQNQNKSADQLFVSMMHQLASAYTALGAPPEIQSLRFSRAQSQLQIEVRAPSIDQLNQLRLGLGDSAELLSANGQDDGVTGRLVIGRKQSP